MDKRTGKKPRKPQPKSGSMRPGNNNPIPNKLTVKQPANPRTTHK